MDNSVSCTGQQACHSTALMQGGQVPCGTGVEAVMALSRIRRSSRPPRSSSAVEPLDDADHVAFAPVSSPRCARQPPVAVARQCSACRQPSPPCTPRGAPRRPKSCVRGQVWDAATRPLPCDRVAHSNPPPGRLRTCRSSANVCNVLPDAALPVDMSITDAMTGSIPLVIASTLMAFVDCVHQRIVTLLGRSPHVERFRTFVDQQVVALGGVIEAKVESITQSIVTGVAKTQERRRDAALHAACQLLKQSQHAQTLRSCFGAWSVRHVKSQLASHRLHGLAQEHLAWSWLGAARCFHTWARAGVGRRCRLNSEAVNAALCNSEKAQRHALFRVLSHSAASAATLLLARCLGTWARVIACRARRQSQLGLEAAESTVRLGAKLRSRAVRAVLWRLLIPASSVSSLRFYLLLWMLAGRDARFRREVDQRCRTEVVLRRRAALTGESLVAVLRHLVLAHGLMAWALLSRKSRHAREVLAHGLSIRSNTNLILARWTLMPSSVAPWEALRRLCLAVWCGVMLALRLRHAEEAQESLAWTTSHAHTSMTCSLDRVVAWARRRIQCQHLFDAWRWAFRLAGMAPAADTTATRSTYDDRSLAADTASTRKSPRSASSPPRANAPQKWRWGWGDCGDRGRGDSEEDEWRSVVVARRRWEDEEEGERDRAGLCLVGSVLSVRPADVLSMAKRIDLAHEALASDDGYNELLEYHRSQRARERRREPCQKAHRRP